MPDQSVAVPISGLKGSKALRKEFFHENSEFKKMIKKLFLIILFLFLAPALCIADTATRVPTGDEGSTGSWTARDGGLYYVEVDDPVGNPDDLTSYIYCTSVGRITFSFSSFSIIPGSTITQVCVYWRHNKAAGPASTFGPVLKVGGNYDTGTEVTVDTSWTTRDSITVGSQWTQNPKTSSDWTVDDINGIGSNALEAFGVHSTDASPNPYCTQVYVEVTYTPAPPVPTITVVSAISQPPHVVVNSTGIVVGAASVVRNIGTSQVTAVTLKENGGTIDAENGLANIELWLSSDTIRDAGDNQLETAKSFNGIDGECTFTETFEVGTTTQYLIVRLDVTSGATAEETIEIQVSSITTTSNVYGIPCDISGTTTVTDNWWSEGGSWSYRKKLVFDNSDQTENLTDFPVMVKLTPTRINYSDVGNADGTDLRFIDSDNSTELKYHIEEWNSSGDSIIWVKVPQIDGSSNIDFIYMYYGNSGASDVQDASGTFSNNYIAVWHMDESSWSGTPDEVKDATQYTNDGQAYGNATTTDTAKLNGGGILDGTGDYVDVPYHSSLNLGSEFTISMWIYRETDSGGFERLLSKTDANDPSEVDYGYFVQITNADEIQVGVGYDAASSYLLGSTISTGQWYHVFGIRNPSNPPGYEIYLDGDPDVSGMTTGTYSSCRDLSWDTCIGRLGQGGTWHEGFDGIIDEVRISTGTRSADWVAAQYESMNDTFINVGSKVEGDATAPEAITNLSGLTWTSEGEIKLTWSAPGDDGWDNPISGGKYGVKWSTYASFDWGGADNFNLEWSTSTSPGNSESKVVAGLTGGVTYYFRIWTADEVPNWSSGLSNGATAMAKIAVGPNKYWVGESNPDNWNDPNNWSATSEGGGGAGVPGADDTAIFDGGNTNSCQIDISSTVASVIIYSTYTVTISINSGESLTTSGSFEIAGGTFTTNGEILDVGSYTQTGGIFNAGGSTVTCNGNFSVTVGTFNAGASVLVLDATDGNAIFTGNGYTFNNVIFQSTGTVARTWTLGGGSITFSGDFRLKAQSSGNLTVTAITNNPDLDIGGSVDYTGTGAGTESISMGEGTWTVGGNVDFSDGTVDASTSTFVLNGTSTQTLTMDGNNLNILQITNSSSDGVYFADNLTLSTFTATTGNTELYFCGGSTFTFTNINFNGQSESSRIVLRSTSTSTVWYLTVTGTQSVSYVDVRESNASGGDTIVALNSTDSGNNTNWTFEGVITTSGSGNWHSTTPDAPWPGGNVLGPADTIIIDNGHIVTSTAPVTISSITVTGSLYLDGGGEEVTFTIGNGGELINNGTVRVSSATYNVTLQGETGGSITFEGNDIDYNGRKIYLARIDYKPVMSLGSGETVELSDSCTFYALTTQSGSSFIQGTNNDIYISSNTTLASGTFTKDAGSGKVYFVGDLTLDSNNQNLGQVVIGSSPDTTTLTEDFTADSLTISSGDVLNTKGYEVTVTTDIVINGMLDCTDSPPDNEGDATIITLGRDWTKAAISTFTVAGATVTFTNASSTSTLYGSTTFYALISTETDKTIKFSSNTITYVTNHLNFENITLRSTLDNATWYLNLSGTQDVSGVDVRDSNASEGYTILDFDCPDIESCYYGNNTKWDFGPPAAITDLTGLCDSDTGDVTLSWSTPGDDDWTGTLPDGSKYRIDYSTYSIQWSTTNYKVSISTSGVSPHTEVSRTITGLIGDTTWYFQIWTRDEVPNNWSGLSNGATVWVNPILSVSISTDTYNFGTIDCATSTVSGSTTTVINDGNVTETYSIKCSSTTKWTPQNTPGQDEFTLQSAFHSSEPADNDLIWKTDDILTESLQTCTTAAFSIDGTEHGKEVPPFDANTRKLWFRLKTPLSTSTTDQQNITITISAEQSP